jgi:outer membrane protein OmpA-like peptidoglycan-associated protein
MAKVKCFKSLLMTVSLVAIGIAAFAQQPTDTTFTLYFSTAQHTTDTAQQKAFKTFLQQVQRVKAITGFADTIGRKAYNLALAQKRAAHLLALVPQTLHNQTVVRAEGETSAFGELWQNRRVDVVAAIAAPLVDSVKAPADTIATLNAENILFIPDQPILTEPSLQYVAQLAAQLKQFKTEKFLIIGHVNYPSRLPAERLKDLYELSEARARVVYNLLIQHGIDASRLTYKGVGNSQPIYAEPINDDQKRKNMRVQVVILRD